MAKVKKLKSCPAGHQAISDYDGQVIRCSKANCPWKIEGNGNQSSDELLDIWNTREESQDIEYWNISNISRELNR